jgi:hypothetical protein
MTAATYTTNLADIFTDGSTTGWTAIGTGGAGLTQETDYFIQGTSCMSKAAFAGSTKGMIYSFGSDAGGSGTDGAYIAWMTHTAPNSLAAKASGGMQFLIGSGTGDYEQYYVGGNDTLTFLGWELVAVNEATAGDTSTGSPSTTVESYFGGLWNLPSGGPTKGAPNVIDGIRYGRCDAIIEFGDATPNGPATFDGCVSTLDSTTNRYGLLTQRKSGAAFENSGLVQFGSSTNAVLFEDSDKTILLRDHDHVTANFHTWEVQNASSSVTLTRITVQALGTTSVGRWVTTDNATLLFTGCSFIDMGVFGFESNATINGCLFLRCDEITANTADLSGSSVVACKAAADGACVIWNVATDPDGYLDDMTIDSVDSTNAIHAIEFGTTSPTSITLRGIDFAGFNASSGQNDSAFNVLRTSGTVTINLVGCSSDVSLTNSYKTAGATVVVVTDPVTTTVVAQTTDGSKVSGALVFLETATGGPLPYQVSVSITQTGGTATVSHTAHGLSTNQYVVIRGATQQGYNKKAQITVTGTNSYTYSVDSGTTSPATGSPVASAVICYGTTGAPGTVTDSRTFASNQPVTGWIRKTSAAPYYKTAPIAGTISNTAGATFTGVMISDE